jgi:DNA repair exonuclease SbcCD ATPase subunit
MSKDLPFIILDEPTTSVDSDTRMYMADYINSIHSNRVVIIISHDESFIKEINNYEVINLNILIGKEYNH